MICVNARCKEPSNPADKVYYEHPDWLKLPKMIVDHCRCGQHNRLWSQSKAKKVFRAAGVDLRRVMRVGEIHGLDSRRSGR